jgi:hypothetical protein
MIFVWPNFFKSSKSLSPVSKMFAFPSLANESRKLSFGSLHTSVIVLTCMNTEYSLMVSSSFSTSTEEKKRLNFGRLVTSKNSSSSSSLNTSIALLERIISSSLVKSLVIRKLIQRFVSMIILITLFRISFVSNRLNLSRYFF